MNWLQHFAECKEVAPWIRNWAKAQWLKKQKALDDIAAAKATAMRMISTAHAE